MNETKISFILPVIVFGIILFPILTSDQAFAAFGPVGEETNVTMYARGGLTSPQNGDPYGGSAVGTYFIGALQDNELIVNALFFDFPSNGYILEGWLIDSETEYKFSLGKFDERGSLKFTQDLVNPDVYDLIVITEEPEQDIDPTPNKPVGGAIINKQFWK